MGHDGHDHRHDHQDPRIIDWEIDRAPSSPSASMRPTRNGELPKGACRGKTLFLDAPSGISGDMTLGAMLDLGVPLRAILDSVQRLDMDGFDILWRTVERSGIVATQVDVKVESPQPERTYGAIDAMLARAPLEREVADLSRAIFRKLGVAESHVHGIPLDQVHFHEVGGVDAIVDIVGAAAAFCWLEGKVVGSPLPMGRGFIRARHGILPLPAPAVVSCLHGVPTYDARVEGELVTPTGAAIAATVVSSWQNWPSMAPERVGWGAGTRELADRPNLLRIVMGASAPELMGPGETHVRVEANLDDISGELLGHSLRALLAGGAIDAWAVPIVMKKGRPGWQLSALAPSALAEAIARLMLRETSTIGVRIDGLRRLERPRRIVEVMTPYGAVTVKICEGDGIPRQAKPEFDRCVELAELAKVAVREVIAAAALAASQVD